MQEPSQLDIWVNSVATACPLSTLAVLHLPATEEVRSQVAHLLNDDLNILGVISDGGNLYLGITSKSYGALGNSLRGLAGNAARAFDLDPDNIVPHGHIYAVDKEMRPVTDKTKIRDHQDELTFCRLFRIRARRA